MVVRLLQPSIIEVPTDSQAECTLLLEESRQLMKLRKQLGCMGTPPVFSAILIKGNNFRDALFTYLEN